VRAQVFLREDVGSVSGLHEAIGMIRKYSNFFANGGRIFSLQDGDSAQNKEVIFQLEGRIQDVILLETVLLGIISSRTSEGQGIKLDFEGIEKRVKAIIALVGARPVYYFGARHWHYLQDAMISKCVIKAGALSCSTPNGATEADVYAVGSIPHALQVVFAWKYGYSLASVESLRAFDELISQDVPRVALIDFTNQEIDDALSCARALGNKLSAVRVDTSGDCIMQGADPSVSSDWSTGHGVTVSGVQALRTSLDENGFSFVNIMLSSGFGDLRKVKRFLDAEKDLGMILFNSLGVGNIFNCVVATMDIVGVGQDLSSITPIAKAGRGFQSNSRLKLQM
jgi:nicotinate phosphoribosyltransferase